MCSSIFLLAHRSQVIRVWFCQGNGFTMVPSALSLSLWSPEFSSSLGWSFESKPTTVHCSLVLTASYDVNVLSWKVLVLLFLVLYSHRSGLVLWCSYLCPGNGWCWCSHHLVWCSGPAVWCGLPRDQRFHRLLGMHRQEYRLCLEHIHEHVTIFRGPVYLLTMSSIKRFFSNYLWSWMGIREAV